MKFFQGLRCQRLGVSAFFKGPVGIYRVRGGGGGAEMGGPPGSGGNGGGGGCVVGGGGGGGGGNGGSLGFQREWREISRCQQSIN